MADNARMYEHMFTAGDRPELILGIIRAIKERGGYQPGERVSSNVLMPQLPSEQFGEFTRDMPMALVRALKHLGVLPSEPGVGVEELPPHWPQR